MKLEIKNEKYNKFLKRKELELLIEHPEEPTPSSAAIQQLTAKQTNADLDKTEVKEIRSSLGAPASKGLVFVWDEKIIRKETKAEDKGAAKKELSENKEAAEEKSPDKEQQSEQ